MVKNIFLSVLLGLTTVNAYAVAEIQVDGNIVIDNAQKLSPLFTIRGNVTTHHSSLGAMKIDGALTSSHSNFTDLTVNGDLDGNASNFSKTIVNGSFNCEICTFNQDLLISSDTATLSATKTKNIIIQTQSKSLFNSNKITHLFLKKTSLVEGNITFQNGQGIVHASKDSVITGKIINGKIEIQ